MKKNEPNSDANEQNQDAKKQDVNENDNKVVSPQSEQPSGQDENTPKEVLNEPNGDANEQKSGHNYDPLESLEQATAKLGGLHSSKPPSSPQKEEKEEKEAIEKNERGTLQKKTAERQEDHEQDNTDEYKIKEEVVEKKQQPETAQQKGARAKLKQHTASAFVDNGDKAQAALAKVVFNWRASDGLEQAKQHRDKLVAKATTDEGLNKKEKAILQYAQTYIEQHQQTKKSFAEDIHFTDKDKEQLVAVLEAYFEANNYEPSPLFTMLMIVGATLFANMYTAFTVHQTYNPPV